MFGSFDFLLLLLIVIHLLHELVLGQLLFGRVVVLQLLPLVLFGFALGFGQRGKVRLRRQLRQWRRLGWLDGGEFGRLGDAVLYGALFIGEDDGVGPDGLVGVVLLRFLRVVEFLNLLVGDRLGFVILFGEQRGGDGDGFVGAGEVGVYFLGRGSVGASDERGEALEEHHVAHGIVELGLSGGAVAVLAEGEKLVEQRTVKLAVGLEVGDQSDARRDVLFLDRDAEALALLAHQEDIGGVVGIGHAAVHGRGFVRDGVHGLEEVHDAVFLTRDLSSDGLLLLDEVHFALGEVGVEDFANDFTAAGAAALGVGVEEEGEGDDDHDGDEAHQDVVVLAEGLEHGGGWGRETRGGPDK